ncbi:MAG TPA: presenilin family intramembrane aspartyl protease PSH [Candidatus Bathyarchaeia archaeon]|nr:presenilin family intramembrane aspartyl protease PSH [Candidatus Bathyarchaeia archaeon]
MNEEEEEREEKRASIALFIGMGSFILLTQIIALLLAAPFDLAGVTAFQNPDDPLNPIIFFIFIIAFTAFILVVLRFGGKRLVYFVMLAAVTITIYYVMAVIIPYVVIPEVCTLALALILFKYPEWYVLDATGLIIGGGAAAIFGISLGILPVLLLLIILAVYDAIAVYKTKHMVSLAESVIDLRMPVLFVLPRNWSFSLIKGDEMEDGFFMGLGDAIIPSVLVVSSFVTYELATPTWGALVGTLAGYAVLSTIAGRGKPHAGLPFLNSGAILGFAIGYMAMAV